MNWPPATISRGTFPDSPGSPLSHSPSATVPCFIIFMALSGIWNYLSCLFVGLFAVCLLHETLSSQTRGEGGTGSVSLEPNTVPGSFVNEWTGPEGASCLLIHPGVGFLDFTCQKAPERNWIYLGVKIFIFRGLIYFPTHWVGSDYILVVFPVSLCDGGHLSLFHVISCHFKKVKF